LTCPYFVPSEVLNDGGWPHPSRLPLGAGWKGSCCAATEGITPSDETLHGSCNLGYARECQHLPVERDWDAVRFVVASSSREQITLTYVCERAHAPVEHGNLLFDLLARLWRVAPQDARVRALAEAYIQSYRARESSRGPQEAGVI
jgi:hypothetical protein